ncbi:MAG: hypothetical protein Q9176_005375 [Flavoplaca citrina]
MIKACDDSNAIKVPGFRVDIVRNVVQDWYQDVFAEDKATSSLAASRNLALEEKCFEIFREVFFREEENLEEKNLEAYYRTLIANHLEYQAPVPSDQSLRDQYTYMKRFWFEISQGQPSELPINELKRSMLRYALAMQQQAPRKLFNTKGGRLGLGPRTIRSGDVVCVFYSAGPLFALRFDEDRENSRLVGDVYMYGLMDLETIPDNIRGADESFYII